MTEPDPRVAAVADALRRRSPSTPEDQAEVAIDALTEHYGSARYWMSAAFERDSIARNVARIRARHEPRSAAWHALTEILDGIERTP